MAVRERLQRMGTEEPVRLSGWVALLTGLGLNAVLAWGLGLDLRTAVVMLVTMALTSIGGLEFARGKVYNQGSVDVERADAAYQMYKNIEDLEGGEVDVPHLLVVFVLAAMGLILIMFL